MNALENPAARPMDPRRCAALFTALLVSHLAVASGAASAPVALHLNAVTALAFSPDQTVFAVSESCGRLSVRRLREGGTAWAAYHCRLGALAFSVDSSLLVSSGENRTGESTIKLWTTEKGAEVLTVTNSMARPRQVLISPDKCLLLAAFDGGGVACWEVGSGRLQWFRPEAALSEFLTFTPDGGMLQWTSSGQPVALLRLRDGSSIHELFPDN